MLITQQLASYNTLLDALIAAPATRPFATMWEPNREPAEQTVTFAQFLDLATSYAAMYQSRGLKSRDTVVLVMPQSIGLLAAFAGALLTDVIPTILAYPTFKVDPKKYRYGLMGVTRNLCARLIVLDQKFPDELAACINGLDIVRLDPSELKGQSPVVWANPRPDDIAFIQHSAGTTGLQKGIGLSHRSVLNQLSSLAEVLALQADDRIVNWLPLYHDMGLIACFILPLMAHIPIIMQSPTDWVLWPASFLRLITVHRCTLCWLPNFAFQFLARRVREDDRSELDLSSLRAAINCSEPVRVQSMEEFYQIYHQWGLARSALQSSYAMAENTFAVTQSILNGQTSPKTIFVDRGIIIDQDRVSNVTPDHPAALSVVSSGRCLPGHQVRVVDQDGSDLPQGAVGEILIRSDSLFSSYYNRPDLTAKALRDGWYWTCDRGFLLEAELFVLGRKDDLIIVGGKNLYPQDIEEIASAHPDVHDGRVIAFGLFSSELGTQELVIVAEVNSEGCLARSAVIKADIRQRVLGEIDVAPRLIHLVPPQWIVKSTAGKPARSTSRQKFLKENPKFDT